MEALSDQNQMVYSAFDGVAVPMLIVDVERRVSRCNLAMGRVLDTEPDAAAGQTCCRLILDGTGVCPDCVAERAMTTGRTESRQVKLKQGLCRLSVAPIIDRQGAVVGTVHTLVQATELAAAEATILRRQEDLARAIRQIDAKNAALEELLGQLKVQKRDLDRSLVEYCERTVYPLLSRLRTANAHLAPQFAQVVESNLRAFCNGPNVGSHNELDSLTPRELEVANLVRGGLSAKEIAELLSISRRSVDNHRNGIRKKLGLTNRRVNLTTYLRTL